MAVELAAKEGGQEIRIRVRELQLLY